MDDEEFVYLSKYGEKYHKDKNCFHIFGKKLSQITLGEAQLKGKMPCKGCTSQSNNQFYRDWYIKKNKQIQQTNFNYNKNNKKEFNNLIKNYKLDDIINDSFKSSIDSQKINNQKSIYNKNNENKDIFKRIEEKKESSDDIDFNCQKYSTKNQLNNSNDSYLSSKSNSNNSEINQNVLNNGNDIKSNNNIYFGIKKDISLKNELLIEKDIAFSFYHNNKNYQESKQFEQINFSSKNKIDNIFNNNQLINSTFKNNPLYLDNIQLLFNYFSINQILNEKNKKNYEKSNIECMEETNKNAQILLFQDSKQLNNLININYIKNKKININDSSLNGCFKYKIEITPFNEDNNISAKISVGYTIEYINVSDMNIIVDENMIYKENKDLKIGVLCEKDEIKKNLVIFKKTGIIYILININFGKMFIVGKEKLEKKQQSNDIFFVKNFEPINIYFLKNIRPILFFDKTVFENFDVKINDKNITEEILCK